MNEWMNVWLTGWLTNRLIHKLTDCRQDVLLRYFSLWQSLTVSVCLSVRLSVCVCLSVCLPVCLIDWLTDLRHFSMFIFSSRTESSCERSCPCSILYFSNSALEASRLTSELDMLLSRSADTQNTISLCIQAFYRKLLCPKLKQQTYHCPVETAAAL